MNILHPLHAHLGVSPKVGETREDDYAGAGVAVWLFGPIDSTFVRFSVLFLLINMAQWFSKANLGNLVNRAKEVVEKTKEITKEAAKKVEAEIQKGQQQYLAEQQRVKRESEYIKSVKKGEGVVLPWETDDEELAILSQDVMERVLSLSLTEQNFTEVPPKLDLIPFVFTDNVATAMRLLALDANLARMHAKVCVCRLYPD